MAYFDLDNSLMKMSPKFEVLFWPEIRGKCNIVDTDFLTPHAFELNPGLGFAFPTM